MINRITTLSVLTGLALSAFAPAGFAQDADTEDCKVSEFTMGLR